MRINNLKINSFGKLEDKYLEFKKFNLIYGDNEAGKSTLLNYIMHIFYGISKNKNYKNSSDYDRFLPWNNGDFSGQINYSLDNGANYRAYRDFCKRETYVYDENNTEISNLFSVDKKLGNQFLLDQIKLDRELIEKTFVINQNSLKILKNDREDLIQKISNLIESGSEEISYEKMQKKLGNLQLENVGSDRSSDRPYNIVKDNFERSNDEINYLKSINDDKYLINKKLNDIDEKIEFNSEKIESANIARNKFKEFNLINEKIKLKEEYFDNDEFFKFIKNTYKFLINKLKSNISIDNKERDCMLVDLNGKVKYVLFTEDIFRFSDYQLSESQLSELKSELIPLLEEVQDKIYLKCHTDKGIPFNLSMSMKEIFDVLYIKNIHIFGSLFKTIDWYPKKIVLVSDFSHPDDFVSAVERFSFIRKLSESKEFDISAILISELEWGYNHWKPMSDNNGTEWVYKRHQQLSGMIKRKISNGYLFSKSCTENFEEKQKFLDVVLSYNTRMPIYKIEVEE